MESASAVSGHQASPAAGAAAAQTAAILSSVGTATYEWAIPSDRLSWSPNTAALLGIEDAHRLASGRAFAQLMAPESPAGRYEAVINSPGLDRGEGVAYTIEYALRTSAGTLWIEDQGRWFASSDGRPLKAHGTIRVINERVENHRRLVEASEFDPLTGQLARHRFCAVLEEALDDAHKVRGSIGFIVAAIDNLSHINEAYGFDIADEIIASVGRRIRSRMRGGDLLGRLSGNKFGILMRSCQPDDMAVAAERILDGIRSEVFLTSAGAIVVSVTMGGVVAPRHAHSFSTLMGRAQEALDTIKVRRRGAFHAYVPDPERDFARRENLRITDEILAALNERQVALAFQPITSALTGVVLSYECLVRVRRADGTLLPAATIVPLAEKLGLIRLIDLRVLELALDEMAAAPQLRLSVNVSPATTMDKTWLDFLDARLKADRSLAARLTIEITETAAIANIQETRSFVARVRSLGARVAIDDFGAGYTSFRNLRSLDVDAVKIDGAFVENFERSDDDRHFVETLLGLARHMKLSTVAEWVPNARVAQRLAELGCDAFQGTYSGDACEERPWRSVSAAGGGAARLIA